MRWKMLVEKAVIFAPGSVKWPLLLFDCGKDWWSDESDDERLLLLDKKLSDDSCFFSLRRPLS